MTQNKNRPPRLFKDKKGFFILRKKKKVYFKLNKKTFKEKNKRQIGKILQKTVINNFITSDPRRRKPRRKTKRRKTDDEDPEDKKPQTTAIITNTPLTRQFQPISTNPDFYQTSEQRAKMILDKIIANRDLKSFNDLSSSKGSITPNPNIGQVNPESILKERFNWNKNRDEDEESHVDENVLKERFESLKIKPKVEEVEEAEEKKKESSQGRKDILDYLINTKKSGKKSSLFTNKDLRMHAKLLGIHIDSKGPNTRGRIAGIIADNTAARDVHEYKGLLSIGQGNVIGGNDGLFGTEIVQILKERAGVYIPVVPIDHISKLIVDKKKDQYFIFNTDKSNKPGKHWIAVYISPQKYKSIEYYDSLGNEPPPLFMKEIKIVTDRLNLPYYLKFKINRIRRQKLTTRTCGYFSVKFILDRMRGLKFKETTGFKDEEGKIRQFRSKWGYV